MKKWVCPVCGYVHEGDVPPAECPVCHVSGDKFLLQSEEKSWAAEHVVGVGKVFGDDVPEEVRKEIILGEVTFCAAGEAHNHGVVTFVQTFDGDGQHFTINK